MIIYILIVPLIIGILFNLKKENIYIKLEAINDYPYKIIGVDTLNPDKICIEQIGEFWYQHWESKVDKRRVETINIHKIEGKDIVSILVN